MNHPNVFGLQDIFIVGLRHTAFNGAVHGRILRPQYIRVRIRTLGHIAGSDLGGRSQTDQTKHYSHRKHEKLLHKSSYHTCLGFRVLMPQLYARLLSSDFLPRFLPIEKFSEFYRERQKAWPGLLESTVRVG